MSEHEGPVDLPDVPEVAHDDASNGRASGSLAERMQQRASELETTVSAVFAIPTWEEVLGVELRLVGWEKLRRIASKHDRVRVDAIKELYVAADQILEGTVQFYEINGIQKRRIEDTSWQLLAKLTGKKLPEDLTPRKAMIALMGDTNIAILWADWQQWMTTRRPEIDEEVAQDFGTTQ